MKSMIRIIIIACLVAIGLGITRDNNSVKEQFLGNRQGTVNNSLPQGRATGSTRDLDYALNLRDHRFMRFKIINHTSNSIELIHPNTQTYNFILSQDGKPVWDEFKDNPNQGVMNWVTHQIILPDNENIDTQYQGFDIWYDSFTRVLNDGFYNFEFYSIYERLKSVPHVKGILEIKNGTVNPDSLRIIPHLQTLREDSEFKTESNEILMPGSDYILLKEPSPRSDEQLMQAIPGGTPVIPLIIKDYWIKLEVNGQDGWMPKWFIVDKNSDSSLLKLDSDSRVINETTEGFLYPGGPLILELEKGNLVKPLLRWNDWVQVSVIRFDIPSVSVTWIPDYFLTLPSETEANEGFLRVGSQAWEVFPFDKISSIKPDIVQYSMPVKLAETKGSFTRVMGPGGWGAWVKSNDILSENGSVLTKTTAE